MTTKEMTITNEDNMKLMARYPDNYFDLAIVDPPYGINRANQSKTMGKNKSRKNSYIKRTDYKNKKWDNSAPKEGFFSELFRVSENQIIWGGNYFTNYLYPVNGWIIWNKVNTVVTYSDGEMAWTSINKPMKIIPLKHSGFRRGQTIGENSKVIYNIPFSGPMDIHPTQKPIVLYEWLFKNYAKEGDKILDTHLGSGSIAIALHRMNEIEKMNLHLTACELDEDYYNDAIKRIKQQTSQLTIF